MVRIKPFKAKPSKSGNSYVITIPAYLIRSEIIDLKRIYEIQIKEVK